MVKWFGVGTRKSSTSPSSKGGYFPVPPVDSLQDIRSEMCLLLEQLGIPCEVHHHEVGGSGQCEIGTKFAPLTQRADWIQKLKYVVHNVAASYGKTATFMPSLWLMIMVQVCTYINLSGKMEIIFLQGRNMLVYQNLRFTT